MSRNLAVVMSAKLTGWKNQWATLAHLTVKLLNRRWVIQHNLNLLITSTMLIY